MNENTIYSYINNLFHIIAISHRDAYTADRESLANGHPHIFGGGPSVGGRVSGYICRPNIFGSDPSIGRRSGRVISHRHVFGSGRSEGGRISRVRNCQQTCFRHHAYCIHIETIEYTPYIH